MQRAFSKTAVWQGAVFIDSHKKLLSIAMQLHYPLCRHQNIRVMSNCALSPSLCRANSGVSKAGPGNGGTDGRSHSPCIRRTRCYSRRGYEQRGGGGAGAQQASSSPAEPALHGPGGAWKGGEPGSGAAGVLPWESFGRPREAWAGCGRLCTWRAASPWAWRSFSGTEACIGPRRSCLPGRKPRSGGGRARGASFAGVELRAA